MKKLILISLLMAGCTGRPPVVPPPPQISTVSGAVTISAEASDDSGRVNVWFEIDNEGPIEPMEGTAFGTEPPNTYTIIWDSTQLPDGDYRLIAFAQDDEGNASTDVRILRVTNGVTTFTFP